MSTAAKPDKTTIAAVREYRRSSTPRVSDSIRIVDNCEKRLPPRGVPHSEHATASVADSR
jgi:hypothetical protein